jgi:hypothetical protein
MVNNKLSVLKKRLIQNAVLIVVILIAFTGGALMLSNYDDDATSEQHSKEGENSQVRSQSSALQEELGAGLEIGNYYDSYVKDHNSDFALKRESVTQWLTDYREKYHITNLSVTISPVTDMKVEGLQLKTGDMVKSEVHLTFSALTDNSVYNFIEAMQRQLPGITVFSEMKITRDADMSRSVLMELSHHKITPLVTADVTFQWLGIRPPDEKSDSDRMINGK